MADRGGGPNGNPNRRSPSIMLNASVLPDRRGIGNWAVNRHERYSSVTESITPFRGGEFAKVNERNGLGNGCLQRIVLEFCQKRYDRLTQWTGIDPVRSQPLRMVRMVAIMANKSVGFGPLWRS